ncbi:MAG: DNA recombination protein RmuC [Bacteriovoracaceae bacterium]|nr:DNA recombination protein RmuC [Bacteriovoracaceae bacterium]
MTWQIGLLVGIGAIVVAYLAFRYGCLLGRVRAEKQLRKELQDKTEEVLRLQAWQAQDKEREQQREEHFTHLAYQIFEDRSNKFQASSQQSLAQFLLPFKENLQGLQKKIEDLYSNESREIFSLKNEIKTMVQSSAQISLDAHNLTKALKGDVKMQGNWGEMVLEKVLELAGLRENQEYILQGKSLGLEDEHGRKRLPDVTIKLPGNKCIFVDAKVSLVSYEQAVNSTGEQAAAFYQDFFASTKNHIDILAKKEYQQLDERSIDFVILFMPIESAYQTLLQQAGQLYNYAMQKSIILAGPTTLLPILRAVAYVWRQEKQNQNVQLIAQQGGRMYDKFCSFVEELSSVGQRLDQAQEAFNGAMNRLSHGKGNLIARAKKLASLGAKTSKTLTFDEADDDEE